jgi:hypothetical protein
MRVAWVMEFEFGLREAAELVDKKAPRFYAQVEESSKRHALLFDRSLEIWM